MSKVINDRDLNVLKCIVDRYITTGEPVSSKVVSGIYEEGLSSATIRNVMARLEEKGYISQPHRSAGRVPTDVGYRRCLDRYMGSPILSKRDKELILTNIEEAGELTDLLANTSKVLSGLSHFVGVVVSPDIKKIVFRNIQFIRVAPKTVLAVLVARSGVSYNKKISLDEDLSQEKLNRISEYLVEKFENLALPEIRARLIKMMLDEKAKYDQFISKAIYLCSRYVEEFEGTGPTEVFVDGTSNILSIENFFDLDRIKQFLETFEDKKRLLKLLNKCIDVEGVQTLIGSENPDPDFDLFSIVVSKYTCGKSALGSLGIIGPTRMPYDRMIPLVEFVALCCSRILSERAL